MKGRVVFLPWRDINTASSRLRCYDIASPLSELGWSCEVNGNDPELADFVVFQKRYLKDDLALAQRCRGKVIFDLCDPQWLLGRASNVEAMARASACVTTSTSKLAQWFKDRKFLVRVIPDGPDLNGIPRVEKEAKMTICWVGDTLNERFLQVVVEPLNALFKEFSFGLKVIGGPPFQNLPSFDFEPETISWTLLGGLEEVAKCHIGIAPLFLDEWCSYKSFNKPLTYMALGLPVVCTSIPSYEEVIENGKSGFLIKDNDPRGWYEAIRTLMTQEEKRVAFISEGEKIVQDFSMESAAKRWDELFGELANA